MSVACQFCGSATHMSRVLSLGYLPPPNDMRPVNATPKPQDVLPTELWLCSDCELVQIGYVPERSVAFPEDYPYTSSATPALRKNFEDLSMKCQEYLVKDDLVVDIGSNDGTLLDCFPSNVRKLGIEPTSAAKLARERGIETDKCFFNSVQALRIKEKYGRAKIITCTNCFAHMSYIHDVVEGIKWMLADDGVFVSESHYLLDLIQTFQYDTIYAEHLRYYTVRSLTRLLNVHGLSVFRVERIPTHGGSIRVYAQKGPTEAVVPAEPTGEALEARLESFAKQVRRSKLAVLDRLALIKGIGGRVVGFGAPSRGSTVISYLGLDSGILEYVAEQPHSLKIGRCMPGTDIPVVDEKRLYEEVPQATSLILFSWHLADQLIPKIRAKGYHGEIILPCSATIIDEPVQAEVA